MTTRPEIIINFHHKVPTSQRALLLAVSTPKDNLFTIDVLIDRSSISLHITFISGSSAIQLGPINRVVPEASETHTIRINN